MASTFILWYYQRRYFECMDYALEKFRKEGRESEGGLQGRIFIANLTLALVSPWARLRLNNPVLPKSLKRTIAGHRC